MQDGVEDYFDDDNRNTEFYFPTFFFIKTAGSDIFSLGRLISFPEISAAQGLGNDFFVFDVVNTDIMMLMKILDFDLVIQIFSLIHRYHQ